MPANTRWSVQAGQNQWGEVCLTTDAVGGYFTPTSAVGTTLLSPTFAPVTPWGILPAVVTQLGVRVGTGAAASSVGIGLYSIVYSAPQTFVATLVAQLNAALVSTAAAAMFGDLTTGAAGSGAVAPNLDMVNNAYIVGTMVSTVTTLALWGSSPASNLGCLAWNTAARASTTDWPASFTQASVVATAAANRCHQVFARTAVGKNWF